MLRVKTVTVSATSSSSCNPIFPVIMTLVFQHGAAFEVCHRFQIRVGALEDGGLVVVAGDSHQRDSVGFYREHHVFGWAGEQHMEVVVLQGGGSGAREDIGWNFTSSPVTS